MRVVEASTKYDPAEGIDGLRDAGFERQYLLRAQADARGLFGGQGERFVVAVGVQRLRAAEHRGHGLDRGADDVVLRLLRGQGRACGLRVEAQHPRARILRMKMLAHDAGPDAARGAELRYLFQKVVMRVEEEGEARGEAIDVETAVDRGLHIGHSIRQGEGDLLRGGGAGLAHVVAGDGDGVPVGHLRRRPRRTCR